MFFFLFEKAASLIVIYGERIGIYAQTTHAHISTYLSQYAMRTGPKPTLTHRAVVQYLTSFVPHEFMLIVNGTASDLI